MAASLLSSATRNLAGRLLFGALLLLAPPTARAVTLTVPDDAPTIRAALDSLFAEGAVVESVFVRVGVTVEPLVMKSENHVALMGIPDATGRLPKVGRLSFFNFNAQFLARSFDFTGGITIVGVMSTPPTFVDCKVDSVVDVPDYDASVTASSSEIRCEATTRASTRTPTERWRRSSTTSS